jgi:UDP-3-O-[3-hydroxymyristoyl] glucosamine N-acyltransferase
MLGGAVGVADHRAIGNGARVGARSGVANDIGPGESWMGYPARPMDRFLSEARAVRRLAVRARPVAKERPESEGGGHSSDE